MSLEDNIRKIIPYTPGEQPKEKVIKLNTNENPYPPSEKVRDYLKEYDINGLRLYPDPESSRLTEAIAKEYGLDKDQIFTGVGSDEVLALVFLTFFNGKAPLLFPDVTYSFYNVWADLFNIPYVDMPLDDEFKIRKEDYIGKECTGIIFPNPNAPTGMELSLDVIEEIIRENPGVVVVVDEAYVDFGAKSALPLIDKYDNLLVVQTFSKSRSFAGMRIGFCMGNAKLIKYLKDVKYSFNSYTTNCLANELGAVVMEDKEYFRETVDRIIKNRGYLKEGLEELGFSCLDSRTNFLFASHKEKSAKEIYDYLRKNGVYVRFFDKPRINNHLRITVGTEEEIKQLLALLKSFVV